MSEGSWDIEYKILRKACVKTGKHIKSLRDELEAVKVAQKEQQDMYLRLIRELLENIDISVDLSEQLSCTAHWWLVQSLRDNEVRREHE